MPDAPYRAAHRACHLNKFGSIKQVIREGPWYNFNLVAGRGEYVDLVKTGIVEPIKVVRIAMENAVSVASFLSLAEATMTGISKPEAAIAPNQR